MNKKMLNKQRDLKNSEIYVYPSNEPLSVEAMSKRVGLLGKKLHAIRFMKAIDPKKKLHVLVKDNIGVEEFFTSAGSKALETFRLPDAFCIKKLKDAGVDVFGKTHMTELAGFLSSNGLIRAYSELGGFGVNPYGEDFPSGGSSSGSCISVAAGLCDAALGTETRGSLMIPGLNCGVWAFKPTRGMISRSGVIPLSSSFDTVGVIGRNPTTIKQLFSVMKGKDPEDMATEINDALKPSFQQKADGTKIEVRLGILIGPNDDSEKIRVAFSTLSNASFDIQVVLISRPTSPTFEYKKISSIDIQNDLTQFLMRYAGKDQPHSFEELVRFYREHPESHPYGMDRLEDAFQFKEEPKKYAELVEREKQRANQFIENLMDEHQVQFLISSEFVDWWSIGGGPTMTFPRTLEKSEEEIGIVRKPDMYMIGGRIGDDLRLLDFVHSCFSE